MPAVIERFMLVRHAMPAVQPEIPAERWELDEPGRAASLALSAAVTGPAYYVSSDEPKAMQTLQEMSAGQPVVPEPAFREVRRPYRWSDDYREQARAYVDGIAHEGWEPHDQVVARFSAAVQRHAGIAVARRRLLVVGTHGLAPTVWLAALLPLRPTAASFWAALTFPDVIEVDLVAKRAERRTETA
jgi:broad specificity phosphatase PhoE